MDKHRSFFWIFIRVDGRMIKLNVADILFFEASDKYVKVITNQKPILILTSLNKVETGLLNYFFCRVHRSYVINIDHVVYVEKDHINLGSFDVPLHKDYLPRLTQRLKPLN